MKKHRVNISQYNISQNNIIYDKLLPSKFPIEYQYLLQEYLIKLQPFYLFAREMISYDIIAKILKIIYSEYFMWHEECDLESHHLGSKYCMQSLIEKHLLKSYNFDEHYNILTGKNVKLAYVPFFGKQPANKRELYIELKENIENLLKCNICAMRKKCKYDKCTTLISDPSDYCKKHMRCPACNCNIRLSDHNCNAKSSEYMQLSLNYGECRYMKNTPVIMDYNKLYLDCDTDKQLAVPMTNKKGCNNYIFMG
jgi:hypothetical protein